MMGCYIRIANNLALANSWQIMTYLKFQQTGLCKSSFTDVMLSRTLIGHEAAIPEELFIYAKEASPVDKKVLSGRLKGVKNLDGNRSILKKNSICT